MFALDLPKTSSMVWPSSKNCWTESLWNQKVFLQPQGKLDNFYSGTSDIKRIPLAIFCRRPSKFESVNADTTGVTVNQLHFVGKVLFLDSRPDGDHNEFSWCGLVMNEVGKSKTVSYLSLEALSPALCPQQALNNHSWTIHVELHKMQNFKGGRYIGLNSVHPSKKK